MNWTKREKEGVKDTARIASQFQPDSGEVAPRYILSCQCNDNIQEIRLEKDNDDGGDCRSINESCAVCNTGETA